MRPMVRNALIALCAVYGVETALRFVGGLGPTLDGLRLSGGAGFEWYQLFTRLFILGDVPFYFFVSLLAVYFLLGHVWDSLGTRKLMQAAAASWVGGTVLAGGAAVLLPNQVAGSAGGYGDVILMLLPLFGLVYPTMTVRLFFVLPVQASWVTWGFGAFSGLAALGLTLSGLDQFGTYLGLLAWWYGMGPGARRRQLLAKSRTVERQLRKFKVLEGGQPDDDLVN